VVSVAVERNEHVTVIGRRFVCSLICPLPSYFPLSETLGEGERRSDFQRLIERSWNDRGYYEIEYRTTDKAKVDINIDAKSGTPVDQE